MRDSENPMTQRNLRIARFRFRFVLSGIKNRLTLKRMWIPNYVLIPFAIAALAWAVEGLCRDLVLPFIQKIHATDNAQHPQKPQHS